MMWLPRLILLCCCTAIINGTLAQSNQYFSEKLTTTEGLGSNKITDIAQDDNGFLWIATSDGLNRFDGTEVKQYYHHPAINSLPHNYIYCLKKLPGNFLAIGTQAGLCFFNSNTGTFKNFYFRQNDTLDEYNNSILKLEIDLQGNLWAVSRNSLYIFDRYRNLKKIFTSPFSEKEINLSRQKFVEKVLPLSDGNALLYLYNRWQICDIKTYRIIPVEKSPYAKQFLFLKNENTATCNLSANEQYFRSSTLFKIFERFFLFIKPCTDSLLVYNEQGKQISSCYFPYNKYPYISWSQQVSLLDSNRLQISFHNFGIAIVSVNWQSGNPVLQFSSPSFFETQEYDKSLRDRQGNWWLATTEEGLQKISPQKQYFNNSSNLINPSTGKPVKYEVIHVTRAGNRVFAGTYGEGVFELDLFSGKQTHHNLSKITNDHWANFTWNIRQVSTDSLWIGTQSGLFWYCISKRKCGRLPRLAGKPGVIDSVAITTQFVDSEGLVWMGLGRGNGICYFDPKQNRFSYYRGNNLTEYPLRYPTNITEDQQGNLWFVNDASSSLVHWDRRSKLFQLVSLPRTLQKQSGNLDAIYYDAPVLWLGSSTDGLIKFNPVTNSFKIFGHDRGLVNSHISSIYKENQNKLWLVTDGGLSCFDISLETFTNFTAKDGLPVQYPTSKFFYDPLQKRLYNGGKGILFYFEPGNIYTSQRLPKTIITGVLVNGKSFPYGKNMATFNAKQNDITIQFTAVDLTNGPSSVYEYKLVGEDTGWVRAGNMRQINFSHLAAGKYTFLVRASNNGNNWSSETASLSFLIKAPFTKTGWFYGLLVLFMGGIFYALYRFRVGQLKKTEQIRREISRNLHDEVGSTLTNISLGTLLAKKQLQKEGAVSHILERIYEDSQHVSESMREIVWSINPKIYTVGETFPRMLHYASELLEARNIELGVEMSPAIDHLKIPMQQRRDLYLIFKEAVNNLAKYSRATKAMIKFQMQENNLVMIIADDGAGFNTSISGSGDGLKNMQERAETHHWKLSIESATGNGTTITLRTQIA